jgi:hypothetical protein
MGLLFIMMLIVCEKSFCLKNEGLMQLMQIASIHSNAHRLECCFTQRRPDTGHECETAASMAYTVVQD